MSAVDLALPRLRIEEGFRALPYHDVVGKWTVGYGCNLDAGLSERAAAALLIVQAEERHDFLLQLPWYAALNEVRQSVCLDISFNAGIAGLLKFGRMIAALEVQDWSRAAQECHAVNPELAGRYAALAQLLLTG
jgi:lysozyme